jgi:hypothetical protein
LVVFPVAMTPGVSTLGFGVSSQVEDFNFSPPHGLTLKDFRHWHGFTVGRPALVQVLNCGLQPR